MVAPSQTLNNEEYHKLHYPAEIRAVQHCNILGECNVQFGLIPLLKTIVRLR